MSSIFQLFRWFHGQRGRRRFVLVLIGWVVPVAVVATTAVMSGDGYGDERLWVVTSLILWQLYHLIICLILSVFLLLLWKAPSLLTSQCKKCPHPIQVTVSLRVFLSTLVRREYFFLAEYLLALQCHDDRPLHDPILIRCSISWRLYWKRYQARYCWQRNENWPLTNSYDHSEGNHNPIRQKEHTH